MLFLLLYTEIGAPRPLVCKVSDYNEIFGFRVINLLVLEKVSKSIKCASDLNNSKSRRNSLIYNLIT